MAAPDFPNSPTVGQIYTAPNGVTYTWDGAVWTSTGTSLQNVYWTDTGTALTPTTATRQVNVPGPTSAMAVDRAPIVLGNDPQKCRVGPLAGASGWAGIYTNNYWNGTSWVEDDTTKRGVRQVISCVDGNPWRVEYQASSNGANTTPMAMDTAGVVDIPGTWSGSTNDWSQLRLGTITARGRLQMEQGGRFNILANAKLASAWTSDDTAKPSWLLGLDTTADTLAVYHAPATTGAPAWVQFLNLNNAGQLFLPAATGVSFNIGPNYQAGIDANSNPSAMFYGNHPWGPSQPAKSSWAVQCDASGDQLNILRRAPNASAGTVTYPFYVTGSDSRTHCTLADSSVTGAMLAPAATLHTIGSANVPGNWGLAALNTWSQISSVVVTTRNSWVLFSCMTGAYQAVGAGGNYTYYLQMRRDGTGLYGYYSVQSAFTVTSGTLYAGLPNCACWDNPGAGAHTYSLWYYGTGGNVLTNGANPSGYIQVMELT